MALSFRPFRVFNPPTLFLTATIWKRHQREITGRAHVLYTHRHVWPKPVKLRRFPWQLLHPCGSHGEGFQGRVGSSQFPFHHKHFTFPSHTHPPFSLSNITGSASIYVSFFSLCLQLVLMCYSAFLGNCCLATMRQDEVLIISRNVPFSSCSPRLLHITPTFA